MIDLPSAVVGLIIGIPSSVIGVLGYKRATKIDRAVESSAVVAATSGQVGQIIEGLNRLIDNLQADNLIGRETAKQLTDRLAGAVKDLELCREALRNGVPR